MNNHVRPQRADSRHVPVDHAKVSFESGFWKSWHDTVRDVTVPTQYKRLDEEKFLEVLDFKSPPGPLARPIQPSGLSMQHFFDSDFGKWIEAASYMLKYRRDPDIEEKIDGIVARLEEGQLPDGYLNSWFIRREPENRWTNLRDLHEMYSMGHLLEGAIAYFEATGKRRFLEVMIRCVEHIIDTFGTEEGKLRGYDAHEEIEIALIKLYRLTGEEKYLKQASYFVDERGQTPSYYDAEARARGEEPDDYIFETYAYSQAHKPVREQEEVEGHAVRATYLFAAMTDLAHETADDSLRDALEKLFDHLTSKLLYVTGGIGSSKDNEGFTREFDLPNETAYAETCASVALGFWTYRMAQTRLDARYTDILELVAYNGALSGIARDGEHYFYENPLESHGQHRRWKWHYCPCCPTNIARFIASIGSYHYSTTETEIAVHLYSENAATVTVGARDVQLRQTTNYPWDAEITLQVDPEEPVEFGLCLRIPGWCRTPSVTVNGEEVALGPVTTNGYARIARTWSPGDTVKLQLPMPVERLYAHPDATENAGRVALKRGPVVYCVEEVDNGIAPQRLVLSSEDAIEADFRSDLLGGATVLHGPARSIDSGGWDGQLYSRTPPREVPATFTAVPYHLWANREAGGMLVWMMER
ncbi:glycoside hydrolase family 127 protein [Pelagovum pacificum]|uniref:Glycoside hydrolase family 127 protein n=1 Tax=Pelagovum pacificum TaxID=2588711 RepID=A0A5C5G9Y2_9RHOB|nr:beta-L-arabinofuranosidase domain-containing protein [Pelagovum pacificum]QQA41788.1 glycoside hydrolase family 127 protein [Pelagovum pacificum]TNY30770.1 glycoside hydrolase family 127 protein [Pelagovum pacificum]